ncbi:MAG TPA: hypothetical protein VMJ10_06240 [Kofleriaceae bacterium]|nr:hypothetical protein [Kofleriaceae bacterium]
MGFEVGSFSADFRADLQLERVFTHGGNACSLSPANLMLHLARGTSFMGRPVELLSAPEGTVTMCVLAQLYSQSLPPGLTREFENFDDDRERRARVVARQ